MQLILLPLRLRQPNQGLLGILEMVHISNSNYTSLRLTDMRRKLQLAYHIAFIQCNIDFYARDTFSFRILIVCNTLYSRIYTQENLGSLQSNISIQLLFDLR